MTSHLTAVSLCCVLPQYLWRSARVKWTAFLSLFVPQLRAKVRPQPKCNIFRSSITTKFLWSQASSKHSEVMNWLAPRYSLLAANVEDDGAGQQLVGDDDEGGGGAGLQRVRAALHRLLQLPTLNIFVVSKYFCGNYNLFQINVSWLKNMEILRRTVKNMFESFI